MILWICGLPFSSHPILFRIKCGMVKKMLHTQELWHNLRIFWSNRNSSVGLILSIRNIWMSNENRHMKTIENWGIERQKHTLTSVRTLWGNGLDLMVLVRVWGVAKADLRQWVGGGRCQARIGFALHNGTGEVNMAGTGLLLLPWTVQNWKQK